MGKHLIGCPLSMLSDEILAEKSRLCCMELAVWKQGSINDDVLSCRLFMLPWFQTAVPYIMLPVRLTFNRGKSADRVTLCIQLSDFNTQVVKFSEFSP
jgi:hypothetical protein